MYKVVIEGEDYTAETMEELKRIVGDYIEVHASSSDYVVMIDTVDKSYFD